MSGLCPACGHENEDLAHLWQSCRAENTLTSVRKRPSRPTLKRCTWHTERDMSLLQQDTQLSEWAREVRSNVEGRGSNDNDDRSTKTAGKIVEEFGGYFCDGRLQIWTDGSCLDPRWEAIPKAGAGVFFAKHSTLNAHFPVKSRTGQTSIRGVLETVACATMALDMLLRSARRTFLTHQSMKGRTPTK